MTLRRQLSLIKTIGRKGWLDMYRKPFQRGGPIIMVQVENEYGSYDENKAYISQIRLRGTKVVQKQRE